jgi:hypothetical protein
LALAGAHRIALLLERSRERIDVEFDLVAGLLFVELDRLAKAFEPGRLVDDDGDRRDAGGGREADIAERGGSRGTEAGENMPARQPTLYLSVCD